MLASCRFEQEIEICKGDEIITECTFSTQGKNINKYVHFGEGTNEEMCVGYITYYPQMVSKESLHSSKVGISQVILNFKNSN